MVNWIWIGFMALLLLSTVRTAELNQEMSQWCGVFEFDPQALSYIVKGPGVRVKHTDHLDDEHSHVEAATLRQGGTKQVLQEFTADDEMEGPSSSPLCLFFPIHISLPFLSDLKQKKNTLCFLSFCFAGTVIKLKLKATRSNF